MEHSEYLEDMPNFKSKIGEVVSPDEKYFDGIIEEWANLIKKQHQKGLIPLFITGSGVSGKNIPNITGVIDMLKESYKKKIDNNPLEKDPDVDKLFEIFETQKGHENNQKKDRSIVARLLDTFQEKDVLRESVWKEFNKELLEEKILKANPTTFHIKLAELYGKVNAVCLTLNFDGLLIREFVQFRKKSNERAFSLPTKKECERFFLRNHKPIETNEFLEIQIRGDILYVTCDTKGYCPQKGEEHSIWASIASYPFHSEKDKKNSLKRDELLKCPACGKQGLSSLSFPGSYKKEKAMKDILEVVWKYLAFRVGSVTVVGMSGEWDQLIVAFLGDLLTEREIPLLLIDVINQNTKQGNDTKKGSTYIFRELVVPKIHDTVALRIDADNFMEKLYNFIDNSQIENNTSVEFKFEETEDAFWYNLVKSDSNLEILINSEFSYFENCLKNIIKEDGLDKFAQLGLKSYWLGIKPDDSKCKYHKRYNHSVGVMKIASYLYDKAIENSKYQENLYEKQFLRLAGLLHDVGHLPFSHLIEDVFKELNWKPAEYKDYYSHIFQTNEKIKELFANNDLKQQLNGIGYNMTDLINLINGRFGIGFLDAIINSPLDADKIDYVFRDTFSTERRISLTPIQFLEDIADKLIITPEKYLSFSEISAKSAVEILQTRRHLYQNLYLQPGIIVLEGIVKLIIKTFFVHSLELNYKSINKVQGTNKKDYPDLGDYKISFCVRKLQDLLKEASEIINSGNKKNSNIELEIVKLMYSKIEKERKYFSGIFFENIEKGFNTIMDTKNEDELKALEKDIIYKRSNWQDKLENEIKDTARDVMFRIPGAAIIEVSRLPNFLSTADSRKERERSDGTKTFNECILIPDGEYEMWTPLSKASIPIHESSLTNIPKGDINVFLYPLSKKIDDSYFKQALNLFDRLLKNKGIFLQE